ncbi:PQQ-dependent sugar dehydrogenase [Turneriella parva]|uniref:Glucose/sorbosone dehydrogenase-like protein n=1 Tax=Turneriella parva (strain ATCC BAA-1111 / DSM 21527 / NCTC 11395 / H) TaxID=869212 RepID=I4B4L7_TURPD|nr:PQQ-dependent sugar dehydrogenase [Turneriella parva]AFM12224.1 glucose/sorbosone dehydrogenase-like protein [Turneriella parva DSM 21527]
MVRYLLLTIFLAVGVLSAAAPFSKTSKIELRPVFHRKFTQPVYVGAYPVAASDCIEPYAVVEKPGIIRLESLKRACGQVLLDIRDRVHDGSLEEGLLGLAFAPDFKTSRAFYIYYSASKPRRTILARVHVAEGSSKANTDIEELLSVRQPYSNHNGGMLEFGPDGYLYIGVGDGGSGGDPRGYAQNLSSHLGKILRIDPRTKTGYKIPVSNPFFKSSGDAYSEKREIFAWGLRNPWRFSFTPDARLIVADVGQNEYEELSFVGRGENMGWNLMEGFHCFKPAKNCMQKNLKLPFYEYDHGVGQSILGGYVYTGNALATLKQKYIFADSVSGRIFAIDYQVTDPRAETLIQAPGLFSSFGRLRDNELVIAELQTGKIYQLVPTAQVGQK